MIAARVLLEYIIDLDWLLSNREDSLKITGSLPALNQAILYLSIDKPFFRFNNRLRVVFKLEVESKQVTPLVTDFS